AVFDGDAAPLDESRAVQALQEPGNDEAQIILRQAAQKSNHRHRRLLRARRERPCGRAAEKRHELAAFHLRAHSITSSALTSRVDGTSRPSALAVLRLMISSYFVGACTGRSAGFSPRRMRST